MAQLLTGTRIYGTGTVDTQLFVNGTNVSTSTNTGALQVVGGVGIGGDLRVGGVMYGTFNGSVTGTATTATNIAGGTPGQVPYQTAAGVTSFYGPGTAGNVLVSNGTTAPTYNNTLTLAGTTAASSTSTGALQVRGGVGIGGNTWIGGSAIVSGGNIDLRNSTTASIVMASLAQQGNTTVFEFGRTDVANTPAIDFHSSGGPSDFDTRIQSLGGSTSTAGQGRLDLIANQVYLSSTQAATSTSTGSLVVTGGVGIGGDLFIQGDIATSDTTFNLINATATTVNFAGAATALTIGATSGSTTVRNNLSVTGNLTVQGTTTIVDSTVTNIADPIITLGGGAGNTNPTVDDNKDRGIAFKWVNNGGTTSTGFFGYDDSTGYLTYIQTATITNEVVSGTKGAVDANLAGGTAMSLVYQSAANTTAFLAAGTGGFILQTNGTGSAPTWVNASGIGAGSATNSDAVRTLATTTNATFYPTFVDSNNASNAYESVYTTSTFNINPATGAVAIGTTSVSPGYGKLLVFDDTTSTNTVARFVQGNSAPSTSSAVQIVTAQAGGAALDVGHWNSLSTDWVQRWYRNVSRAASDTVAAGAAVFLVGVRADGALAFGGTSSIGTAGQVLQSNGAGSPSWVTISASSTGTTSTFVINNSTAATSTNTGALQVVNGGAGIGGNIYAGGDIYSKGTKVIPLSIQEFTATAGQITFTVSGGYTVGTVQVFANGINLDSTDFAASNGTTVVVAEPRAVNDRIKIVSGGSSTAANNIQNFSIAMSVALSM